MRLHILGIGGTFMSGIALLAKQCGYEVSGSDMNVYPPMSTQLIEQGIPLTEGYDFLPDEKDLDCIVVGNVIKRGNPSIEYVLEKGIPFTSGPEWLAQHILKKKWVLGVSGTHGKTTTSSLLTFILEAAGKNPSFLIGGIPENFGMSARLTDSPYFVIEADEYDSAFFDKRSKFIHYHPRTLIMNNLEYDHADIFPDLDSIKQQFHYLVRTVPPNGLIVQQGVDPHLKEVIERGCWTPVTLFNAGNHDPAFEWGASVLAQDGSAFTVYHRGKAIGDVKWDLLGLHNINNALAAIAAATHVDVSPLKAIASLAAFKNVKRRLEKKGVIKDIVFYDDFAHHPTAIAATLASLRARIGKNARLIAILEFGSYTMRVGVHKHRIQEAFKDADMIICKNTEKDWGLSAILEAFNQPTAIYEDIDLLVKNTVSKLRAQDHVIIMSNSGFNCIHKKFIEEIENRSIRNS